jgi:glycyl-tRNA synthetase (class II)
MNIDRREIIILDNPSDFMSTEEERVFFQDLKSRISPKQVIIVMLSKLYPGVSYSDSTFEMLADSNYIVPLSMSEEDVAYVSEEIRNDIRDADPYNSENRLYGIDFR